MSFKDDKVHQVMRELDLDETEARGPRFRYPSGVPGVGNSILGPRILGSSIKASTTTYTGHEQPQNNISAATKRKLSELDSYHPHKSNRLSLVLKDVTCHFILKQPNPSSSSTQAALLIWASPSWALALPIL
jgi:hypothetical protein